MHYLCLAEFSGTKGQQESTRSSIWSCRVVGMMRGGCLVVLVHSQIFLACFSMILVIIYIMTGNTKEMTRLFLPYKPTDASSMKE
jgi:hypothetical protein